MLKKNNVLAIPLSSLDSNHMDPLAYTALNTGLPEACFLIRIINDSDEDVTVSYDGVVAHDFVPSNYIYQISFQSNSQPNSNVAYLRKGTIVYLKGAQGAGFLFLAGYYQP